MKKRRSGHQKKGREGSSRWRRTRAHFPLSLSIPSQKRTVKGVEQETEEEEQDRPFRDRRLISCRMTWVCG